MFRIGVDIGGTFTDFAIWKQETDSYVEIGNYKAPTSRPNLAETVMRGVEELVRRYGIATDSQILVVHGTTVSTNAVIERSQPKVALITTKGYRDLLTIARLRLAKTVDFYNARPEPPVRRSLVFEVTERLLADGTVDTPFDEEGFVNAVETAIERGASGVAICFLHAHRNPMHEKRALVITRKSFPDLVASASHEVWPQQSEYERAILTVLNVYIKRLMEDYLRELHVFLRTKFPNSKLYITKSNGGIMSVEESALLPIHTLLSGPAAGVTAARMLGSYLGLDQILTFDMGGTSTDVSLIDGERPMTTALATVGDFPLMMPVTAVEAMGAGGGSIIRLDGNVLKVGPRSAGSYPGPACYGQGGVEPTLSDAYLIVNYLTPKGLLGGKLALHSNLAEQALAPIAKSLDMDVVAVAEAAIDIATSNMLAKVTPFLARVGVGATDLTLMIFGGAGGVHGPIFADEIGIKRMVVPRIPSVFCAFGGLVSDLVHDGVKSIHGMNASYDELALLFRKLRHEGQLWLEEQSFDGQLKSFKFTYSADMRYAAQSFAIPVDVTDAFATKGDLGMIINAFHAQHRRLFGHSNVNAPVVIDDIRVRSIGLQPKPSTGRAAGSGKAAIPVNHRKIRMRGRWHDNIPVYEWKDLPVQAPIEGPAIVQQDLATILIPMNYSVQVGKLGDLELSRND